MGNYNLKHPDDEVSIGGLGDGHSAAPEVIKHGLR